MKSFEEISRMNLADLDRPDTISEETESLHKEADGVDGETGDTKNTEEAADSLK